MNSDAINIVAHSAIAITAPHAGTVLDLPDAGMVYLIFSNEFLLRYLAITPIHY
jgi:hypothetical protein